MSEPMSPRAVKSREKMLRAATELLVEHGPRSVTVDAVTEASGVAKSTLYRHWASRDELLIDVVRCSVPDIAVSTLGVGFEPALRSLVGAAASDLADAAWSRIFPAVTSLRTSMPELDAFIEADMAAKRRSVAAILDLGVAEGALPGPIDVNDAANMLIGPLAFMAITKPSTELPDQLAHLAEVVVDRFIASYR